MANTKIPVELSSTPGIVDGSNATAITIDSSENVGIGTTSPSSKLHVYGGAILVDNGSSAGTIYFHDTTNYINLSSDALQFANNGAERLRIDSSGQIGVGTTSPQRQFHIAGGSNTGLKISGNNTGSASGDGFDIFVRDDNSGVELVQRENTFMTFHTNNTERMRIDSSGRLLLGTTVVGIDGSSSGTGVVLRDNAASLYTVDSDDVMTLNRLGTDGTILRFRNDGTSVGYIATGSNSLPSDRNFKKDIEDLEIGLNLIKKLKPAQYNYKIQDDGAPKLYGLIAQDLEQSLIEVGVEKNSTTLLQYEPDDDEKESDYKLDYLKLTPVLINAIQEQQELIETQQTTINDLKSRIETLEG